MQQVQADLLLIDDRRAKRAAVRLQLPATGTIGVLRTARDAGLILAALPLILQLRSLGFRVSLPLLDLLEHEERGHQ
jgi:predicted nucleic acid-binding protein